MSELGLSMKIETTKNKFLLQIDGIGALSEDDKIHLMCKIQDGMAVMIGLQLPSLITHEVAPSEESTITQVQPDTIQANQNQDTAPDPVPVAIQSGAAEAGPQKGEEIILQPTNETVVNEKQELLSEPESAGQDNNGLPTEKEEEPQKEKEKEKASDRVPTASTPGIKEPKIAFGKYSTMTATEVVKKYREEGVKYLKEIVLPTLEKHLPKYPENSMRIQYVNNAIASLSQLDTNVQSRQRTEMTFADMALEIQTLSAECGDYQMNATNEMTVILFNKTYAELLKSKNRGDMQKLYQAFLAALPKK